MLPGCPRFVLCSTASWEAQTYLQNAMQPLFLAGIRLSQRMVPLQRHGAALHMSSAGPGRCSSCAFTEHRELMNDRAPQCISSWRKS